MATTTPEQRDLAQKLIIESSQAAGYPDSTCLSGMFKHELTDRIAAALTEAAGAQGDLDTYLECAMCDAPKSFVISPRDPSEGYCFAENQLWKLRDGLTGGSK